MNQFSNPILNYFNKIKIKLPVKKLKKEVKIIYNLSFKTQKKVIMDVTRKWKDA